MRRRILASLLFLPVGACAGDGPGGTTVTVRDSAGILIVESTAPTAAAGEGLRIAPEPEVQIGVAEGDPAYQFQYLGDVTLLDSGQILVVNGGSNEIRVFDAAGQHLRTFGGTGSGPGEFQSLHRVQVLPGDSLMVVDYNARRVSFFTKDATFLGSEPIEDPFRIPAARLPDGRFRRTISLRREGDLALGPHRDSIALVAHGLNDAAEDTIVRLPGNETLFIESSGAGPSGIAAIPQPFGLSQQVAFRGDTLIHGDGARPQVAVRELSGQPVRMLRWSAPDVEITSDIRERYRARRMAFVRNAMQRRTLEQSMEHMPARVPHFDQVLPAADGRLWIHRYMLPGDSTNTWTVLAPEGHWETDVLLPPAFNPLDITADLVAGRWRDEYDVEYVRVYRLQR